MATKKKTPKAEAPTEVPTEPGTATATEPVPETKPKKGKGKKKNDAPAASGTTTLADIAAGYLSHMEGEGKSDGTISSYRMELKTAAGELGESTPIADLTPERVQKFFDCARVTKLRSGKSKAKPSIDKTRRVLRLALVWAQETKLIDKAPVPEEPAAV